MGRKTIDSGCNNEETMDNWDGHKIVRVQDKDKGDDHFCSNNLERIITW